MAVTIQTDMTLISNCDATTGWSAGTTNDSFHMEGTACLGIKVSNNTSAVYSFTFGTAVDFTGKFAVMTMMITGRADTYANGGYRIYFEDSSGNNSTYYVGGNDTHTGGWGYFAASPEATRTSGSGTLDVTDITKVGVQMKTITNAIGNTPNIFWDVCHYGSYLGATSLVTDTVTMADLASADATNYYGLIREIDGVYFCRGKIILGQAATTHINFADSGSALVWINDVQLPYSSSGIEVLSSSTTTSNVEFSNGVIKGYVTKPSIDTTDVDIDGFSLDTVLVQNLDGIDLEDNSTISGCILDGCGTITQTDGTFEETSIGAGTGLLYDFDANVEITDTASASLMSDMNLYGYSNTDQFLRGLAVYVPATVTSMTMDNWQFDVTNDADSPALVWGGTSGTLTISATNGTNLTSTAAVVLNPWVDATDTDPFGDSSCTHFWQFENDLTDDVGSWDFTATGMTYATGVVNNAGIFDGSTSKGEVDITGAAYGDFRAISFWFKPGQNTVTISMLGIKNSTSTPLAGAMRIMRQPSGGIWAYFYDETLGNQILKIETSDIVTSTSTWYHIVINLPATTSSTTDADIYVNAVNRTDVRSAIAGTVTFGSDLLVGGSYTYNVAELDDFDMDQLQFWDRILTLSDIKDLYYARAHTATTGTIVISQDVTVAVANVVVGSSVYVATVDANGDESTVLINEIAATSTVSTSTNYAGLDFTSAIIRVRNSSGTPKYLPYRATGTISASGMSVTANQIKDTIAT